MPDLRRALLPFALLLAVPLAADGTLPMPEMSAYQFGLLRRGPAWSAERTPASDSIQAGHLANIGRMAEAGILVAAGPLLDGGDLRGVLVFRADSVERLRAEVARDPAVRAGRLTLDLHPWFAPAGIGEPYRRLARQPGHRDSMVRLQLVLLRRGPRWTADDSPETRALQAAHVNAILAGLAAGELVTAGPFGGGGDLRGVLVYRGDSTAARRRALDDPAVRAGRLAVELHPWFVGYGSMPGDTAGLAR